ncbi:MAG: flippase [Candidatus Hadarchaeales archaeon]
MSETEKCAKYMARGSIIIFLSFVLSGLAALLIRVFLARNLAPREYGMIYAAFYFVSFFGFFRELGLTASLTKYIPEFLIRKDYSSIRASIKFVLLFQVLIVGTVSLVLFFLSPYIASGFIRQPEATQVLRYFTIWLFFSIFYSTLLSVFQGFRDIFAHGLLTAGFEISILVLLIPFLFLFNLRASGAALAYLFGTFALCVTFFFYLRLKHGEIFSAPAAQLKAVARPLLLFSIPLAVASIFSMLMSYIDTWAVTAFCGVEEVGYYQVAQPAARLLYYVAASIVIPLFPLISELWAKNDLPFLNSVVSSILRFSFLSMMPPVLVFIAFPEVIIRILFGGGYLPGALVLQIFAVTALVSLLYKIFSTTAVGIGKSKIIMIVAITTGATAFALNMTLVPVWGMKGAAFSQLIAHTVGFVIYAAYLCRFIKFSIPVLPMIKTIVGSVLTLLTICGLKSLLVLPVFIETAIVALAGLLFYAIWILATKALAKNDLVLLVRAFPIPRRLVTWAARYFR